MWPHLQELAGGPLRHSVQPTPACQTQPGMRMLHAPLQPGLLQTPGSPAAAVSAQTALDMPGCSGLVGLENNLTLSTT